MAPHEAAARYAASQSLSSGAGFQPAECRVDARKRELTAEQFESRIDRRRHRCAGDGYTQRLRELAEPTLRTSRKLVEQGMDGRGIPLRKGAQLIAKLREHRRRIAAQMLGNGLGVELDALEKEEAAVLRHLLEGLRALALSEDHSLEQPPVVAVDTDATQLLAQIRHQRRGVGAHHVLLVEPQKLFGIESGRRFVHVVDIEGGDHFLPCEELLIAVAPTETNQVIEDSVR